MKAFFAALQTNADWQLPVYGLTALAGFDAEGFSVIDSEASLCLFHRDAESTLPLLTIYLPPTGDFWVLGSEGADNRAKWASWPAETSCLQ